jgi:twinkle protein
MDLLNELGIDFKEFRQEDDAKAKVRNASLFSGDLKAKLRQKQADNPIVLPWQHYRDDFAFRPGEMTLWAGQNGSGKSLVTSQLALSLIGQGQKVTIASFEMKPVNTLQRMARQWIGMNPMAPEFQTSEGHTQIDHLYDQFSDWISGRLWLYDQMGAVNKDLVIGMCRYSAKELGVQHIFIDNLATCVMGEDDMSGQKDFVSDVITIARDYNIHLHLIHHLRKPMNEYAIPNKYDTKGSGAIVDLVDNMFMVWRNKEKEDDMKDIGDMSAKKDDPDQLLLCRKQRNYEGSENGEPTIKLFFHKDAQQYLEGAREEPMAFYNWPHTATK